MKKLKTNTQTKQRLVTLLILVLIMVILSCISNKYLTFNNLINIVRQESTLIIIACAATMLMISGGMDLSPAGVFALIHRWYSTHKGSGQKPAAFSHFFSSKLPAHQNTATMPLTSSPGFSRG